MNKKIHGASAPKTTAQSQMILPLLEVLDAQGGQAATTTIYDGVAERIGTDGDARTRRAPVGTSGQVINLFERNVRWSQQLAKARGLIRPVEPRHWELTGKGRDALHMARPGTVITIFVTDHGVALYGRCEDAIGVVENGSVQLLLSSPPYPLLRKKRYGNQDAADYVDWLVEVARAWPEKLTPDGSIVLNLGDVWEQGRPTISLYQERLLVRLQDDLGLRLCQRFAWENPAKLPAPAEWVTIRRVRVKPSLEQVYWLSPHEHAYADNRAVLRPYSASMRGRLTAGGETGGKRPSGHQLNAGAFGSDNGGSIPGNLIQAANTDSNDAYLRYCREHNLPVHPARMPARLAEFLIRLTTRPEDIVFDPFGGSLTTGAVAEALGRQWVSSETSLEYLLGARGRFTA